MPASGEGLSYPAPSFTVTATPPGGGPALIFTTPGSPMVLNGLLPNTAYIVTVVANCSATSASPASAPLSFRTPLAARNADLATLISLHPNPAHTTATLMLPAGLLRQAVAVTLCNALGQVVRVYPAIGTPAPAELDLSRLAAGVYTLRLDTAQGSVSKRLLVE